MFENQGIIPEKGYSVGQKIIFAFLGMTKSGKTTAIAALTKNPEHIIQLSLGDDCRTKVTVEYHFATKHLPGILVENIEFFKQSIMMSADGTNKQRFNEEIEKNKIFKDILKLEKVLDNESLLNCIDQQLDNLKKNLNNEEIKSLINTEGIDKYIKKIVFQVSANDEFANYLKLKGIDLYIRDTRGLLDIMLEEVDGEKRISNLRPLNELGLDKINGAVFFCSENYPGVVATIYKDTFNSVFQSVPFFLIARDSSMIKLFRKKNQEESIENVLSMIQGIQNNTDEDYDDAEAEYFLSTLALLEGFSIVKKNNNLEYQFKDLYFKQSETEFLTSSSSSLKRAAMTKDITAAIESLDFRFYKLTVTASIEQMTDKICELYQSVIKIVKSGKASNILMKNYQSIINELQYDLQKYNVPHATEIVRPQLASIDKNTLENNLVDKSYDILGKYDGITTLNKGKLKYASTAVIAVTGRRCLTKLIEKINLNDDLVDADGNLLVKNLSGRFEKQEALLKKVLYYILYHNFTDNNASIQYYLIVNRKEAKDSIEEIRSVGINSKDAVSESISNIIKKFSLLIQDIDNIDNLFKN